MIDVLFLGTGGGMPMTYRYLSSVLLSYGGRNILLDCGEGTQVAMREFHTGFRNLDIIFITHLHGDHIFGLPGLISTLGNSDRTEPVTVVGPTGIAEACKGLFMTLNKLPFEIKIIENPKELKLTIKNDRLQDAKEGELTVKSFNLRHRIHCFAYSFELKRRPKFDPERAKKLPIPIQYWKVLQNGEIVEYEGENFYPEQVLGKERRGIKISFIGDTAYFPEISEFVGESDLLISEATYGDDADFEKARKNSHMTYRGAAMIARDGKVKKLILTHFAASMIQPVEFRNNAVEVFQNTWIAKDGFRDIVKFEEEE